MARPKTVSDDERKLPCAVSLNNRQRATFHAIGGSRWLQATLDRIEQETPKVRPARKKA